MSDAAQKARQRRMKRAGYAALVPGWVPAAYAARVKREVDKHRADVERIEREAAGTRGRPMEAVKETPMWMRLVNPETGFKTPWEEGTDGYLIPSGEGSVVEMVIAPTRPADDMPIQRDEDATDAAHSREPR